MAGTASENLLGVRDAILRYFHDGLDRTVSVAVVPQTVSDAPIGLPFSDEETLRLARQRRARSWRRKLGDAYHFYIASESGIHAVDVDGGPRYFIRYWTVMRGTLGEAWGSSGSVQIPDRHRRRPGPGADPVRRPRHPAQRRHDPLADRRPGDAAQGHRDLDAARPVEPLLRRAGEPAHPMRPEGPTQSRLGASAAPFRCVC